MTLASRLSKLEALEEKERRELEDRAFDILDRWRQSDPDVRATIDRWLDASVDPMPAGWQMPAEARDVLRRLGHDPADAANRAAMWETLQLEGTRDSTALAELLHRAKCEARNQ